LRYRIYKATLQVLGMLSEHHYTIIII